MILQSTPLQSPLEPLTSQMSNWFYEKNELRRTPSFLDNVSYEVENRYRREGARFIQRVGSTMKLRYDTMATGTVYFHRFYMHHSFKSFPRFVTASCCLFLAGKVEETPKKCKDIIKTARTFLSDQQFNTFGEDPKEEVLTLERIVLQTIRFDLQLDHPYSYLLRYAKSLKGDKEKLEKMVQMAWTFINDSLCTTICLQWEPEIIAIALMFLAGKLSKFEVIDWQGRTTQHKHWWDMFVEDISVELLEDICHQVLDLYSTPLPDTPQDSPPNSPAPTQSHSVTHGSVQSVQASTSNTTGIMSTAIPAHVNAAAPQPAIPVVLASSTHPQTQPPGIPPPPQPPQPPGQPMNVTPQLVPQAVSQPHPNYNYPPPNMPLPPQPPIPPPPPAPPVVPINRSWDYQHQHYYQQQQNYKNYGAPPIPPLPPQQVAHHVHVASGPMHASLAPPRLAHGPPPGLALPPMSHHMNMHHLERQQAHMNMNMNMEH